MQRLQSKFRSFLGVGSPIKPKNTTLLEKRESVHKFCLLVERLVCTSPSFGKCLRMGFNARYENVLWTAKDWAPDNFLIMNHDDHVVVSYFGTPYIRSLK